MYKALKSICLFVLFLVLTFDNNLLAQTTNAANTSRLSFGTFSGATESNADVVNPKMSKDGRFVVFESTATNLVNTATGKFAGFNNIDGNNRQIYLYDRQSDSLEIVSINGSLTNAAPMDCYDPVVSSDGRYVAFVATTDGSQAEQMNGAIDGDLSDGNSCINDPICHVNYWVDGTHVWIRDRLANKNFLASQVTIPVKRQTFLNGVPQTATELRLNANSGPNCGEEDPSGVETNVPVVGQFNLRVAQGIIVSHSPTTILPATAASPNIGGDGRFTVFDSDSNYLGGIIEPDGYPEPVCGVDFNINPGTNDGILDGAYLAFPSRYYRDSNDTIRDVFIRDGQEHTTNLASYGCKYYSPVSCALQGYQDAIKGAVSDDGTIISWQSPSNNLLSLDFNQTDDIFVTERSKMNGEIEDLIRISNSTNRITAANGSSINSSLSADGRYIAFQSAASNIVSGDTNAKVDIFIYDTKFFTTVRCALANQTQGNEDSLSPTISSGGEFVSFHSASTNLGASGGFTNAFLGKLNKNSNGRLISCVTSLASIAGGTGANNNVFNAQIGVVPVTDSTSSTTGVRRRVPAVSYQTSATNVSSLVTDTNNFVDIYQAPICQGNDGTSDLDGDGTTDCFDQCWLDPLKVEDKDDDFDGVPNCEDGCPTDAQKITPGACGCGAADIDSDNDGTFDCVDLCPNDPLKTAPGACGCGQSDVDSNLNGIADCNETTNPTPTVTPTVPPSITATPIPDFTEVRPQNPELYRVNNTRLNGVLASDRFNYNQLSKFEVQIRKIVGKKVTVSTKRFNKRNNSIILKNLKKGTYQIRFRGISTTNTTSRWSGYSKKVSLR